MATVYVSIGPVASSERGSAGAFKGDGISSETITSSGTSARGSLTAPSGAFAQVVCATAVYARSGAATTVTATATNGVYVPANIPTWIEIKSGDVVAVIDV